MPVNPFLRMYKSEESSGVETEDRLTGSKCLSGKGFEMNRHNGYVLVWRFKVN